MLRLREMLRSSRWTRVVASAGAFALVALAATAQSGDVEQARRRWRDLSPEKRRELVERYDRMRQMPAHERARLHERFRCVERMHLSAKDGLTESARRDLSKLDPSAQREALAGVVAEQIGERGRRLLDMIPSDLRER